MVDQHSSDQPLDVFVPLREAAQAYEVSVGALRVRARAGGVRAYKVAGPAGREWRVSLRSLEASGLALRVTARSPQDPHARVLQVEAEVAGLRRVLAGERRRADRADQELGHALLEGGRLRAELSRALEQAGTSEVQVSVAAGCGSSRSAAGHDVPEPRS